MALGGSTGLRVAAVGLLALGAVLAWTTLATGTQPYETYESKVASDGPVAQFRFDDASGSTTIADSAGSYTATNTGITLAGEGPFGGSKSGKLGGEAYATLPDDPLEGAKGWSAEGWIKWVGGSSYKQPVFDFGSNSTNYVYLTPASSLTNHTMLLEIHTSGGSSAQVSAAKLSASEWEYVAVTETGEGTLTLYLNGKQVGQTTGASVFPSSLGSSLSSDYLGKSLVTGDPDFKGSLSNVAFYTKALSATQIEAHYNDAEFPVNTVLPTITGTAKDGSTLTAKAGTWTGLAPITFAYQWTLCNGAGGECAPIGAATESKYTLIHEDVAGTLRVEVNASNSAGFGSATSAQTGQVAAIKPSNKTLPVISGSAKVGQVLSVSDGTWEGSPPTGYSYQWESCNSAGASCKHITAATASSYRVAGSLVGDKLRAIVMAENSAGSASATSEATAVVVAGAPVNVTVPVITGSARDEQSLSASMGVWAGSEPITYAYQWQLCSAKDEGCADIAGATSSSLTLTPADVGDVIDVVVTASNSVGSTPAVSSPTAVVAATPPVNVLAPAITGSAVEGQALTASEGSWNGTPPLSYAYQWERCESDGEGCVAIAGAGGSTYALGAGDVGTRVRVTVTASNAAGSAGVSSQRARS